MPEDKWGPTNANRAMDAVGQLREVGQDSLMQAKEFLKELFRQMGGPKTLAKELVTLLTDPDTPRDTKRRVAEGILAMMKFVEQHSGAPADLTQFTDAELQAIVAEAFANAA